MISFKDWFYTQESSASTRARTAAFLGLGPKIASPFSHSTPHPGMIDKLLNDLKPKKKKKKKKKKKIHENQSKNPDYSFDAFVKKMIKLQKDIQDDLEKAEEKDKELDKKEKTNIDKEDKKTDNDKS